MTWVTPPTSLQSETRSAEEIRCGIPSGAEVVYAEFREAEEAADRRHDFSDHLEPFEFPTGDPFGWSEAAWSWHMGPGR